MIHITAKREGEGGNPERVLPKSFAYNHYSKNA